MIKNNREKEDSASKNSDGEVHLSADDKLQKGADSCFAFEDIPLRVESEMNSLTPSLNSSFVSEVEVENKNTKKTKLEELAQEKTTSPDEMLPSHLHSAKSGKEIPLDQSNYEELDKFLKEITWSNLDGDSKNESITETSEQQMLMPVDEDITGSNPKEQTNNKDCSADSSAPNAVILKFADSDSVPSEDKLNSVFSRYGPLRESETYEEKQESKSGFRKRRQRKDRL